VNNRGGNVHAGDKSRQGRIQSTNGHCDVSFVLTWNHALTHSQTTSVSTACFLRPRAVMFKLTETVTETVK